MKRSEVFIIIGLIIAGVGMLAVTRQDSSNTTRELVDSFDYEAAAVKNSEGLNLPDNYIEYREGIIEETAGTKILNFHSTWCLTCVALERDISENGIPDGITIIKVDYDKEEALRQKYGVTLQTFLIHIDDEGNEIKSHFGGTEPKVTSVLSGLDLE